MIVRHLIAGRVFVLLASALSGFIPPLAFAAPPGPGDAGYCGAHTSPLDCWADTGPITPGEAAFIAKVSSFAIPGMPTDSTRLLQIGRGTCQMLTSGVTTEAVVRELASDLGKTMAGAGQILNIAMETACPGLSVGPDGVARSGR